MEVEETGHEFVERFQKEKPFVCLVFFRETKSVCLSCIFKGEKYALYFSGRKISPFVLYLLGNKISPIVLYFLGGKAVCLLCIF